MKFYSLLILSFLTLAACSPKSDVDEAKREAERLKAENAELKAQLAKKPALPVSMSLRKAMMGPGYVAMFNTTVKSPVPVLVTVKSAALGTIKKFELHLKPNTTTELGHAEGAAIGKDDIVTIENNNYSSVTFTVNVN